MGHVRLSDHINAPIDQVWDLNASCERLPEWNVNVVEVKDCQGRLDRVGARATTVVRVFGRKIEGSQETTQVDKPHAFTLKLVGAGGAKATVNGTYAASWSVTSRTTIGLAHTSHAPRTHQMPGPSNSPRLGRIVQLSEVGGLHHRYQRQAA